MSRIRIYGDTSGYIDIKAPDEAGNTDVVIPEGGFVGQDQFTSSLAEKAPSASPTFTGTVALPLTTNYDGTQLSTTLGSKLDLAGGKILQIVRSVDTTARSTTSTSMVDIPGMSVTITPQKSDSALLIISSAKANASSTSGGNVYGRLTVTDSSDVNVSGAADLFFGNQNFSYTGTGAMLFYFTLIGWATPGVTTAVTYKTRFRVDASTTSFNVGQFSSVANQMFAIEVSA